MTTSNRLFSKRDKKHYLNLAKEAQAENKTSAVCASIGSGYQINPLLIPRYTSKAGLLVGLLLYTSAVAAMHKPLRDRKSNPLLANEEQCVSRTALNLNNTLTIYHARDHFWSELVCANCDGGNFYADRHSIRWGENSVTQTVRNEYFDLEAPAESVLTIPLTDEKAAQTLNKIKQMNAEIKAKTMKYEPLKVDCITYTQNVYAASGASGYFTDEIDLFASAGVVAHLRHATFGFMNLLKIPFIFFHQPENTLDKDINKLDKPRKCLLYDAKQSFFSAHLCTRTPTGQQVLARYRPPSPDCEMVNGRCVQGYYSYLYRYLR